MADTARTVDIRRQRDQFLAYAFAVADLLLRIDRQGRVLDAIGAISMVIGGGASLSGRPLAELLHAEDRRFVTVALSGIGPGSRLGPMSVRFADAASTPVQLSAVRLPTEEDVLYLVISAPRWPLGAADPSLTRDSSTGLLDAGSFARAAGQLIGQAEQLGDDIRLTLLGLDDLDGLGSRVGPEAMERLYDDLGEELRARAVDGRTAGRLDGDKFGVVHRRGIGAEEIRACVEQLARRADPHGAGCRVRSSKVELDARYLSQEDGARALLYTVQTYVEQGPAEFSIDCLSAGVKASLDETLQRIVDLKHTVAHRRIKIAFQPVVDIRRREPHHFEVLARLDEQQTAGDLIRFAEKVGLVEELDLAIGQKAVEYLRAAAGNPYLKLAVNVSAQSLESAMFVDTLMRLVKSYDDLRGRLLFELTETVRLRDLARADRIVQDLRRRGFRVCLDDFGSGAACFQYLQALDVDFVKIDGAYIDRIETSRRDGILLRAIANLCLELGTGTIAERIERPEQASFLLRVGIGYGQGYFYGRPASEPSFRPAPSILGAG